jgi:hypothetical protein
MTLAQRFKAVATHFKWEHKTISKRFVTNYDTANQWLNGEIDPPESVVLKAEKMQQESEKAWSNHLAKILRPYGKQNP